MSYHLRVVPTILAAIALIGLPATALAQTGISVSSSVVSPGQAITVTVTGVAGRHFAVIGSSVGAGFSFGGVALRVGPDVRILAVGVLPDGGSASVAVTPPFAGTTLDRFYLQAATSTSPSFASLVASEGVILRNADVVGGGVGPQGPPGPPGPAGPQGVQGPAGPVVLYRRQSTGPTPLPVPLTPKSDQAGGATVTLTTLALPAGAYLIRFTGGIDAFAGGFAQHPAVYCQVVSNANPVEGGGSWMGGSVSDTLATHDDSGWTFRQPPLLIERTATYAVPVTLTVYCRVYNGQDAQGTPELSRWLLTAMPVTQFLPQ